MGFFGAAHGRRGGGGWGARGGGGGGGGGVMKRGTIIPYLRKIQKIYKSRDTSLDFC